MRIVQGTLSHVEGIAQIYLAAFPKSVRFFFTDPASERVRQVVSNGFALLMLNGGQAKIALSSKGQIIGYCLYTLPASTFLPMALTCPRLKPTLKSIFTTVPLLKPKEAWLLIKNKYLFAVNKSLARKPPSPGGRILSIAVNPRSQGQGVGKALLKPALAELETVPTLLEVRSGNEPAQAVYSQLGFEYYGKTQDLLGEWLMMVRPCANGTFGTAAQGGYDSNKALPEGCRRKTLD